MAVILVCRLPELQVDRRPEQEMNVDCPAFSVFNSSFQLEEFCMSSVVQMGRAGGEQTDTEPSDLFSLVSGGSTADTSWRYRLC